MVLDIFSKLVETKQQKTLLHKGSFSSKKLKQKVEHIKENKLCFMV